MASVLAVSKRNARQRQNLARGIGYLVQRNSDEILHSMLPDLFDVGLIRLQPNIRHCKAAERQDRMAVPVLPPGKKRFKETFTARCPGSSAACVLLRRLSGWVFTRRGHNPLDSQIGHHVPIVLIS